MEAEFALEFEGDIWSMSLLDAFIFTQCMHLMSLCSVDSMLCILCEASPYRQVDKMLFIYNTHWQSTLLNDGTRPSHSSVTLPNHCITLPGWLLMFVIDQRY